MGSLSAQCEAHPASQHDISTHTHSRDLQTSLFYLFVRSPALQFKYLDKDEFASLRSLRRLRLDGNQLSVVVDDLFSRQKSLEHLGKLC